MQKKQTAVIRSFNRRYTSVLGILDKQVFDTSLSWPEGRLLLEISFTNLATPLNLAKSLGLDKSYTSRLLKKLANKGFIEKRRSKTDLRSIKLNLTKKGEEMVANLNRQTDKRLETIFAPLSDQEQKELYQAITTINQLLFMK